MFTECRPPRYVPAVGEVVETIMVSHPSRDLPQTWSAIYCYVTATIVARRNPECCRSWRGWVLTTVIRRARRKSLSRRGSPLGLGGSA